MDDEDGLMNIEISDDESSKAGDKAARKGQTEAVFQGIKREYRAKVENGNIYKGIKLPLPPDANKQHNQEVLHAVEELYFFRRYQEAVDFIHAVLQSEEGGVPLDDGIRNLLNVYLSKCQGKMSTKV